MPGGRISSPSSPTADMSWVACGDFEHVEFAIFFLVFLAGLASNILFVLFSFRKVVDAKGCFEKPNPYVVQWSMANLVILVFFMPLDILSFTTSGSWFFGRYLCRFHFFVERAMYFVIAAHFINMIRDCYRPFGFSNVSPSLLSNWIVSSALMTPVLLTTRQYAMGGCTQCQMVKETLPKTPMFQWCELIYVAVVPSVTISFCSEKYGQNPDYENATKAGADDKTGISKLQLRPMCIALATVLVICTVPARLMEMLDGDFKDLSRNRFLYLFIPRLLIHGQPILFALVCASYYPTFHEGVRKAAARIWGWRQLQDKIVIRNGGDRKPLI